jgi:hypothetical protein
MFESFVREEHMQRHFLLSSFLVVIATFAMGQSNSRVNVYAGYSFLSNDPHVFRAIGEGSYFSTGRGNLNGWNASGEVKVFHWVGLVADFNGSYGSIPIRFIVMPPPTTVNTHVYTYLFGPRVPVQVGRLRPFAEAFVGADSQSLNTDFDSVRQTHFASAFGGGVDISIVGRLAWRLEADYLGSRHLSNVPLSPEPTQHNFRFSTGVVFHF